MFRLENESAPIEIIYTQLQRDWVSLSDLFQKQDPRGCPLLAIYNVKDVNEEGYKVRQTLEFHPEKPSEEVVDHIITRTFDTNGEARYSKDNHAVILNRATSEDFTNTLTHEGTHAVVNVGNDEVFIATDEFTAFHGYYAGFGRGIHRVLKRLGISQFRMGMGEFFPPIGQAHLLGKDFKYDSFSWQSRFYSLYNIGGEYAQYYRAMYAHSLVLHVPQIAGELMVRAYKGDVPTILREHPQLALFDGQELWQNYAKPLLTTGKLG